MPRETTHTERLYNLLPAVHRLRDAEQGDPLRALLGIIDAQLGLIEGDIEQLYDNWFIETCDDWVVPYLADLVAWKPVAEAGDPASQLGEHTAERNRFLIPRRAVADTVHNRRRKGTLALLEELAADVAGWPARAVEFVHRLAITTGVNHMRQDAATTVDVRAWDALGRPPAFDRQAHLADVRRIGSRGRPGLYNVPNVGLFVWRLRSYPVTRAPAYCLEDVGREWFTFSALGNDAPLFSNPRNDPDTIEVAPELSVPAPIRREALLLEDALGRPARRGISPDYYGVAEPEEPARSFAIWAEDWPSKGQGAAPIPAANVIAADLSDFSRHPPRNHVAVDPVLGRIAFPKKQPPKQGVFVSYHYGFSADIGGGQYPRTLEAHDEAEWIRVQGREQLREALRPWVHHRLEDADAVEPPPQPEHAVIEIADNGVYVLPINLWLASGHTLQLRAAQGRRPIIRLLDWQTDQPDSLAITGGAGSRFTLDGVLVAGRGMRLDGELASVTLRHSTLVPGWTLKPSCEPGRPTEPSISLVSPTVCLVIERSIVGPIQVNLDEVTGDPVPISIRDSIVDGAALARERDECVAIGGPAGDHAHAVLTVDATTVIGRTVTHAIERAENSIFTARVTVARRQIGCMRFCSVTPCSRTPRRHRCQPDLTIRAALKDLGKAPGSEASTAASKRATVRVTPRFTSLRYGTPAYAQLALDCAPEIARGAEDESELGAFHHLYQPQRVANLTAAVDEYVPAATEAGIFFAT